MKRSILVATLAFVSGGCVLGHADLVRRDLQGGILALRGDRGEAMDDADRQMSAHCRGPYTIVAEENAVVGQHTDSEGSESRGQHFTVAEQEQTTTNVTEYRITYVCGTPPPPPGAPPPQPAPSVAPTPDPNAAPP